MNYFIIGGLIVLYFVLLGWMVKLSIEGLKKISDVNKSRSDRIHKFLIQNRAAKFKVVK